MADNPDQKIIPIVRQRTDKTFVFYANDSWIGSTRWEMQINFGRILSVPPGAEMPDQLIVEAGATIIMTLEHAEAFQKALTSQIEKGKARRAEREKQAEDDVVEI